MLVDSHGFSSLFAVGLTLDSTASMKRTVSALKSPNFSFSGQICLTLTVSTSGSLPLTILEAYDDKPSELIGQIGSTNGSQVTVNVSVVVDKHARVSGETA